MVSARNNNVTFISLIRVCMCFFDTCQNIEWWSPRKPVKNHCRFIIIVIFFRTSIFKVPRIPFQLYRYWYVQIFALLFVSFFCWSKCQLLLISSSSRLWHCGKALSMATVRCRARATERRGKYQRKFVEMWRLICTSY